MTDRATIVLRPLATPLPLGFAALAVTTSVFSAVQLGWVPQTQSSVAAFTALAFAFPMQLLASVVGFACRDPVAATGMGVLAGTWGAAGLATLTSPPGATSPGLGAALLASAVFLLVPAIGARRKPVAAAVMALSSVRFAVTGVAEASGAGTWMTAAGVVGLVLAAVAGYAALAFELEGADRREVLPVFRKGSAAAAEHGRTGIEDGEVGREAGVRAEL